MLLNNSAKSQKELRLTNKKLRYLSLLTIKKPPRYTLGGFFIVNKLTALLDGNAFGYYFFHFGHHALQEVFDT